MERSFSNIIFTTLNVQESSDSEQESNDASGISRKPLKRKRGRDQISTSKDVFKSYSSADGCLSLLKRKRSDGKRICRFT